jgi:hypothetical protein
MIIHRHTFTSKKVKAQQNSILNLYSLLGVAEKLSARFLNKYPLIVQKYLAFYRHICRIMRKIILRKPVDFKLEKRVGQTTSASGRLNRTLKDSGVFSGMQALKGMAALNSVQPEFLKHFFKVICSILAVLPK